MYSFCVNKQEGEKKKKNSDSGGGVVVSSVSVRIQQFPTQG
jgi:hypothetical protein